MPSKHVVFLPIIFLLLLMCDKSPSSVDDTHPIEVKPNKLPQTEYIFNEDTIRTYEILIDSESLDSIDNDPVAEQYRR